MIATLGPSGHNKKFVTSGSIAQSNSEIPVAIAGFRLCSDSVFYWITREWVRIMFGFGCHWLLQY